MKTIPVLFARSNLPFCWVIRLFTLSKWSHCAIMDGDFVIDTTLATGVRRISFNEWKTYYTKYEIRHFPVKDKESALAFARNQIGKDYDPMGILSLVLRKNLESKTKWFCSELVATVIGIKYKPWKLSPQFLKMLHDCINGWIK